MKHSRAVAHDAGRATVALLRYGPCGDVDLVEGDVAAITSAADGGPGPLNECLVGLAGAPG